MVRAVRNLAIGAVLVLGGCDLTSWGGYTSPMAYALGGTVSGLRSAGLVLANSTGQAIDVSANAQTFTFGAVVESNASYAVTVRTQPTGEQCTVANGSGTMHAAAVGNVVVTCSPVAETLGGTISGLNGSGLALANGSDTLSVPAGATSFTLPTKVAYGSSYAVTVKTQPRGLACAVSEGAGTMPANAVTDVAVTCTDQPFSLGGTIAGLTTGGLVLANGGDTVSVPANATSFVLPTKVVYGAGYAVSVRTQPLGLSCTVSQGSGSMPAGNVTNVAVVCADQTYQLGGTISGLTASGLMLANGTDTLVVAMGATGFSMPAKVAYGASYSVIVQAQPAGLLCTVSGGAGTMPASNVVGVLVTCATDTYTVGGSISGLTASGLVLANGSDTLTVAANAAIFTMPTGVASGSPYAVVVQAQPTGQLCSVANGSGTVGSGDVSSIQVSCTSNVIAFTTVGPATWTVPAGVTSIQVAATGGGGGGGGSGVGYTGGSLGGNGGIVTATLSVNPGDTLNLYVGGGGGVGGYGVSGGFGGGGGGGGSSSVNVNGSSANQIVAGGGGGGFGEVESYGNGGDGNGGNADTGQGGGYGGANGIGGSGGSFMFFATANSGGNGNGGPGGVGAPNGGSILGGVGGAGSGAGSGGAADLVGENCSGGGGGGYGGGGAGWNAGGGGGGSTGPAGASFTLASNGGNSASSGGDGSIVITANP